jgi:hypothetical protein
MLLPTMLSTGCSKIEQLDVQQQLYQPVVLMEETSLSQIAVVGLL